MAWKTLRHQNLLPLLGVTISDSQFVMGSEWMVNGNINEFVKTRPDVNRFELVCFQVYYLPCSLPITIDLYSSKMSPRD